MKQITKKVARQFFQLGDNKQEMLCPDGKAIYPVDTYLEIGKIIDLQDSDIDPVYFNMDRDDYGEVFGFHKMNYQEIIHILATIQSVNNMSKSQRSMLQSGI